MVYWSASATPARLAIGTAGYTLQATANGPSWTQTVAVANGGTGKTSWTQWGVLYASASTTLANTAAGTAGYLLQANSGAAPSWINATSAKTGNTIVKRNSTGGFLAGTIAADSLIIARTSGQYITINSNNVEAGELTLSPRGTTSAEGWVTLTLGNNLASTVAENASGKIVLYHSDGGASTISAKFDSVATTTKAVKIDTGLSVVNSIETTTGYIYARGGSIWAGTTASTTGERDVGARAGSGNIYLYAAPATNGDKGLYATSATNGGAQILTVNQSSQISYLATINCTPVLTAASAFTKAGQSVAFIKGRDTAIIKTTSYSGYNAAFSLKTTAGDWSFGVYNNNSAYLTYASDTNYSSNTNTWGGQVEFRVDGTVVTNGQLGAVGAGEHYLEAQNSTYGNILRVDVSGNGQTAGIWSSGYVNSSGAYTAGGKWLIYRNPNNAVVIGDNLWISGWGYSNSGFQINGTYTQLINNYLVMPYWTMYFTSGQVQFHFNTNGTGSLSNKVAHLTSSGVFTNSSKKVKTNIIPLQPMGNIIDNLKPVEFSYTYDPKRTRNYGLIYEDTVNILPYICDSPTSADDRPGINYAALTPVLLKEIQDLRKRVKTLEEQLSQN